MPQFPVTDARRKILERIPDYEVAISDYKGTVLVTSDDLVIARSSNALLVKETRHDDVFYLPRSDVDFRQLVSTDLSTYCPFKGHANYWSHVERPHLDNFVWSYETPYPEVGLLGGYLSFYTTRVSVSTL